MTAAFDEAAVRHWLVDYLVTNIGCSPDEIDLGASMHDLGVGSRDAVVLTGELSELLGRPVSPVEFWQYPTINALARFLTGSEPESAPEAMVSRERGSMDEPIAVIGLGCRFPGDIRGPEELWQFLSEGRSAVGEVPPDRWAWFDDGSPEGAAALAGITRWGSFLSDVDAFDAEFFEISPREAARMDPQQRLLLEVAHEALEHAGIPADSLAQTQTGVFAGACAGDYAQLASTDLGQVDAWSGTGGALSIIANRVSYFFDLRGPSVTVDTACSSSLVAVHLACQSLRAGDSNLALAAGVNLLLSPAVTRSFDQAEAMSRSGQCHAFDARADGFVRGEGCGVAVLKRLGDALRDGDRVLAVVRGSAVNQDGRSNGLMAPNPAAQMAVLRAAYANAGVEPREVDYVEAHGTGTLLGDPIEARALGTVLGRGRPADSPLLIGAVKSNLGHLEAAAGVAGFLKAVLAVQRGRIPANLGFSTPNPHIPFDNLRLKVVAEHTDWVSTGRPRRAGVSSFGFGGTNAHVVLEQGPDPAPAPATGDMPQTGAAVSTLVVSGKTPERIASWAGVLADWMDGDGADVALAEVAHTLNHHRAAHAKFATVAAGERGQAVAGLRALAAGRSAPGTVGPHEGGCRPGTVFVYSGQGSQWAGMGRQLLADEPVFAAAVAELEPVFVEQVGFSLRQVLAGGEPVAGIDRIQPVLVGLQLALTELWRCYGVEPDAVIGHSMGEVSAAVVAGALSAAEGLRVIATRSRLMARLSGQGAMALLELDPESAEALIADYPDVTLAVYASPRQTVIAGPPEQVDAVIAVVDAQDRLARRIEVDVASHHPTIDPILPELRTALADLTPKSPTIPFISTVADTAGPVPVLDAEYWVANVRQPVRFHQAIATAGVEYGTFVEVSPHPLLTYAITDTLGRTHHHSIGTLQRDTHDTVSFHANLNATHTTHPPHTDHRAEPHPVIPTTPWHHSRHWLSGSSAVPVAGHPLLGIGVTDPTNGTRVWECNLSPDARWLGDYRVDEACVLPEAAYAELALAAARTAFGSDGDAPWMIRELHLDQSMHITDGTVVVTTLSGDESKPRVEIRSRSGTSGWTMHASATLARMPLPEARNEQTGNLFTLEWEPVDLDKPASVVDAMLLLGDLPSGDPLLRAVKSRLSENVAHCDVIALGDEEQLRHALTRKDMSWNAIAVVCPPRPADEALTDTEQLELAQWRTTLIADVVKTVSTLDMKSSPRLWIVTRGAQPLTAGEGVTLAQTALRGIARVLAFEHPELKTTIVDVDADGDGSANALTDELLADPDHDEVALRDGQRYVNRLVPLPTSVDGVLAIEPRPTVVNLDDTGAVRLQIDQPGRLETLAVHETKRTPPADGQVEVRVVAAGLDFRDVLKATGVHHASDGDASGIGGECVGYVTARGSNVGSLEIGQRVIAIVPGAVASYLTAPADLVIPVPDALGDHEAATLGVAYLTAWHALCEVGRLAPGERVLIHSASSGVGLAAVSMATMIGARIYTTAGSAAKRKLLSEFGVEYVGDSRTVEFADEILRITDDHGVDVILNSLSGESFRRGVEILAPGGRFIEIGKKDVYADAQVGLAPLSKSASFSVVDLDVNLRLQPQRYRRLLQDILGHVMAGELQMLPVTHFSLANAGDALRLMASGSHTGKIVISIPAEGSVQAIAPPPPQPLVRHDGGYVVVGGMGGLGLVMAQWLAAQGAGMVVLNGRSAPSADVAEAIAEMNAAGCRVEVVTGNIAEPGTAVRLVAAVEDAGLRPAGVLHSAMVLADEMVLNMSQPAATQVFAPKVAGNWWLHEATAHLDLDWWMTFSSAASILGSPGQGAYAAANSWVDGLVAYRRSRGLPAVGINWGPWAEVGRAQFLADLGFSMITPDQGLAAVRLALAADRSRTAVFSSLDARRWFESYPAAAGSSLFAKLGESAETMWPGGLVGAELDERAEDRYAVPYGNRDAAPVRDWSQMSAEQLRAELEIALGAILAHQLGMPASAVHRDRSFPELGLDSMMAMTMLRETKQLVGIELSATMLWNHPTISSLAACVAELLAPQEEPEDDDEVEPALDSASGVLDELFDSVESATAGLESATAGSESGFR